MTVRRVYAAFLGTPLALVLLVDAFEFVNGVYDPSYQLLITPIYLLLLLLVPTSLVMALVVAWDARRRGKSSWWALLMLGGLPAWFVYWRFLRLSPDL